MNQTIGKWEVSRWPEFHPLPVFIGPIVLVKDCKSIATIRWLKWSADKVTDFSDREHAEPKPKSKLHWTVPVLIISLGILAFLLITCALKHLTQ